MLAGGGIRKSLVDLTTQGEDDAVGENLPEPEILLACRSPSLKGVRSISQKV